MFHPSTSPLAATINCLVALWVTQLTAQQPPVGTEGFATDWGEIRIADRGLHLHIAHGRRPTSGTVRIPRLNNPVAAIYVKGDSSKSPLKLTPHVADWDIALPPAPGPSGRMVIVVETVGRPRVAGPARVIRPSASGVVTLAAHDATTRGQVLRYEPQPHKNTLGYWSRAEDWCQWRFQAPAGRYDVEILQGCGQGHGGSEVALIVGGREIIFTVEETGHFQNFRNRSLGTIELTSAGEQTLQLRPRTKKAGAVMDVRQVRLLPVHSSP